MFPCSGADDVDINRFIEDYRNIKTAFSPTHITLAQLVSQN